MNSFLIYLMFSSISFTIFWFGYLMIDGIVTGNVKTWKIAIAAISLFVSIQLMNYLSK